MTFTSTLFLNLIIVLIFYNFAIPFAKNTLNKCIEKPNTFIPFNKLYYEGDLYNNLKHGYGTLYFYDGSIFYKGEFYNNEYHGIGLMYNFDKTVYYNGIWTEGKKLISFSLQRWNSSFAYHDMYYPKYYTGNLDLCTHNVLFNNYKNLKESSFYIINKYN